MVEPAALEHNHKDSSFTVSDQPPTPQPPARPHQQKPGRWYLPVAVLLLLLAAFFRTWDLGSTPPGMHAEELVNAQISDRLRAGEVAVIYDEVSPGREGLYYAYLAGVTAVTGRGLMLWRLPSVWIGMLSLAVMTQLIRRLFGVRVALFVLALAGVTFWPVWMSRSVLHVALLPLAISVTVYTLTRAFQARELTTASLWFTVGGLSLGLAQYVHVTAWVLIVLGVLFVGYYWLVDPHSLRRHRANILYTTALAAVVALPLTIFLLRHPGVREPVPLAEQPGLITEVPERLVSSLAGLALRGDMLPEHNLPGRPVLEPSIAVLMVIGIGVAIARWRQLSYGLALLWLLVGLLPTAFLPQKPDFEHMAAVLPIIFAFPAIGLGAIFSVLRDVFRRIPVLHRQFANMFGVVVAGLIAAAAIVNFHDYFLVWPQLGDVRLNYQADLGVLAHYLDASADPTPISICSTPVDTQRDPFALTNQELLSYLMHRHDLPIRYFDCTQGLVIAEGGRSQRLIFPRGHYYDHLPGPLLAWLRYAENERVPGVRPDVIMRLEAEEELANYAGAFITTALTAWPPEAANSSGDLANLPVTFGHNISFLGYDLRDDSISPGDWVELTTYWRMDGPPPQSLNHFTHMLSSPVIIVAQRDNLGVQPGTLYVRDVFLQHNLVQAPPGLTPGPYTLSVGLYFPATDERLPAFADDAYEANRLFLQSVSIER